MWFGRLYVAVLVLGGGLMKSLGLMKKVGRINNL
jgi:hypothetical protein